MRVFICYVSLFCLALVPVPIFFDLNDGRWVLERVSFPEAVAPVPVGLVSMALSLVLYFVGSLLYPEKYKRFVGLSVSCLGALVFVFLVLWSVLLSEANILRVVQVYMPLLLLLFISYPAELSEQRLVFWAVWSSMAAFVSLHIVSMVFTADDWLAASPYEFAMFYGYGIYQSLVTYTAVVALYFIVTIGAALRSEMFAARLGLVSVSLLMLMVLALGARKASLVEVLMFLMLSVFFAVTYFLTKARVSGGVLVVLMLTFPLVFVVDLIISLPVFERSVGLYASGSFDSGRFEIYERALRELSEDYVLLFVGHGSASGYHNFALDLVYTIGLIPLSIFLMISAYILVKGIKKVRSRSDNKSWVSVLLFLAIASCLIVQSMVNASVTQPYYLINLLMVMLMLHFMPRKS